MSSVEKAEVFCLLQNGHGRCVNYDKSNLSPTYRGTVFGHQIHSRSAEKLANGHNSTSWPINVTNGCVIGPVGNFECLSLQSYLPYIKRSVKLLITILCTVNSLMFVRDLFGEIRDHL